MHLVILNHKKVCAQNLLGLSKGSLTLIDRIIDLYFRKLVSVDILVVESYQPKLLAEGNPDPDL